MRSRLLLFLFFFPLFSTFAQTQTVGLFQNDPQTEEGYILWAPILAPDIYLMDNCGRIVHSWNNGLTLGNSMYLLEDGSLLRTAKQATVNSQIQVGGSGERIQRVSWEGDLLWEYFMVGDTFRAHHDIAALPNGNVLILAFDLKNKSQSLQAGRDPALLTEDMIFTEYLVEVEPTGPNTGDVVWEWHLWDHLIQEFDPSKDNFGVVRDHPEKLDLNFINSAVGNPGEADWIHSNALAYNPYLDQIILSSQRLGEIYIIDHSTSTAEAASSSGGKYGRGGDFLYRWGNPQAYQRGDSSDQQLFGLHDCKWIEPGLLDAGKIILFNNGLFGRNYSSVDVIEPPQIAPGEYILEPDSAYGPAQPFWSYTAPNPYDFYSFFISGAQRLSNGNTLICSGAHGNIFEVDYGGNVVWQYVNPQTDTGKVKQGNPIPQTNFGSFANIVFRAEKYPPDFAGFNGRDLSPKGHLEADPFITDCEAVPQLPPNVLVYPNPASRSITIWIDNVTGNYAAIQIYDAMGRLVWKDVNPKPKTTLSLEGWLPGLYVVRVGDRQWMKFVKPGR